MDLYADDDDIITKKDLYNAIRGYKYQNCPVLSGLNKTQLGSLVNKYDLTVEPSGVKNVPTGKGLGRTWKVKDRTRTTWKPVKDRIRDKDGMELRFTGNTKAGVGEKKVKKKYKSPLQVFQEKLQLELDEDTDEEEEEDWKVKAKRAEEALKKEKEKEEAKKPKVKETGKKKIITLKKKKE